MKRLFRKARDAAVELDETMPEIRDTWCVARDALWAYVRMTIIITAGILALGVALGLGGMGYALLSNAHADTIVGDMDCSKHRRCGYMKPVYHAKPLSAGGGLEFTGTWEGATADGHNPRISCPSGTVQHYIMQGDGVDRDYTCWNINAAPAPEPRVDVTAAGQCDLYNRGCGSVELWPLSSSPQQYYGHWPGGWHPRYGCPPGYGKMVQDFSQEHLGVYRFTCKII